MSLDSGKPPSHRELHGFPHGISKETLKAIGHFLILQGAAGAGGAVALITAVLPQSPGEMEQFFFVSTALSITIWVLTFIPTVILLIVYTRRQRELRWIPWACTFFAASFLLIYLLLLMLTRSPIG